MKFPLLFLILGSGMRLAAGDAATDSPGGKKAEQQSCVACHSLRIIESQRLPAAAWKKEVTKMIGWGAVVPQQEILVEYLSKEFSDLKPVPAPDRSVAGTQK